MGDSSRPGPADTPAATRREAGRAVAVIPARAGSKRLPGKNIRDFCGKPLLVHTISASLESGLFADVIVSTDSERIQEVAQSAGATTGSLRPAELSDDQTPVTEVTLAVLEELRDQGRDPQFVAQLLPTSPLRTAVDILASFRFFLQEPSSPLVSLTAFAGANPWWTVELESDGRMRRLFEEAFAQRSQDQASPLAATGAVWWMGTRQLEAARSFYLPSTRGWEVPWPGGIDIDSQRDWHLAESLAGTCR